MWLGESGRRVSNPLPTAWKAVALPNELLPRSGERRIRTSEVVRQQIYSLPHLAALESPRFSYFLPLNKSSCYSYQKQTISKNYSSKMVCKFNLFFILNSKSNYFFENLFRLYLGFIFLYLFFECIDR